MNAKIIIAVVITSMLATACALLKDENTRLRLLTQYSTMKVIDQSSNIEPEDVLVVVQSIRVRLDDSEVTLDILYEYLLEQINWDNLSPADKLLLFALFDEAATALALRIDAGVLRPDDKVAIRTLLEWVESAAKMY